MPLSLSPLGHTRLFTRREADELYVPIHGLGCFALCRLYQGGIGIGGYIEGAKSSLAINLWWTFPVGGGQILPSQVLFPILYLTKAHIAAKDTGFFPLLLLYHFGC